MAKKLDLDFRGIALGLGLAAAFVFVVGTAALLAYLLSALWHPKPSTDELAVLSAWATLVGNMIGAVFSGLLAVAAAFGAVYLEHAEKRKEKRLRKAEITRLLAPWARKRVLEIAIYIDEIRNWFEHPDPMERFPLFIGGRITEFSKILPEPKIRAAAETEYLPLAKIFTDIEKCMKSIELNASNLLGRSIEEMQKARNTRAGCSIVAELVAKLTYLAGRLAALGDQIDDIETKNEANNAYKCASALELSLVKNIR